MKSFFKICQWLLMKLKLTLSGLRLSHPPQSQIVFFTSISSKGVINMQLSAFDIYWNTILSNLTPKSSTIDILFEKNLKTSFFTSLDSSIHLSWQNTPFNSVFNLLHLIMEWKYLELESPCLNQRIMDFCWSGDSFHILRMCNWLIMSLRSLIVLSWRLLLPSNWSNPLICSYGPTLNPQFSQTLLCSTLSNHF